MSLKLHIFHQSLPLTKAFKISRGSKTTAEVILVILTDGKHYGWGEAVPYTRYGESIESVYQQLEKVKRAIICSELDHQSSIAQLPAGSARNALDCAFWDLSCKQQRKNINELIDLPAMDSVITAQTVSVDHIDIMKKEAAEFKTAPLIKVKLGADCVIEKMSAIYEVCPKSQFIIDANEGWSFELLNKVTPFLVDKGVVLIEQPLPANEDAKLAHYHSPIPICADESCHTSEGFEHLLERYQSINIKLDKTGGLTEALSLLNLARQHDLTVMLGCMVGSSLAMAPAYALCGQVDFVDLDGPIIVKEDRENGFGFDNGIMQQHPKLLWGKKEQSNTLAQILTILGE